MVASCGNKLCIYILSDIFISHRCYVINSPVLFVVGEDANNGISLKIKP